MCVHGYMRTRACINSYETQDARRSLMRTRQPASSSQVWRHVWLSKCKDSVLVSLSIICICHSRIFKVSGIKKILWMSFQDLNDNLKRKRMPPRVLCRLNARWWYGLTQKLIFDLLLASFKGTNDIQHISAPI